MENIGPFRQRKRCALCRSSNLSTVLDLENTPLANEYVSDPEVKQEVFPLFLVLCGGCGHLQMGALVDPYRLFSNYKYVTGTSEVTRKHLTNYAAELVERFSLKPKSFVVEIGSNDGTMLRAFKDLGIQRLLGVDPAQDIAARATAEGLSTLSRFFTAQLADEIVSTAGPANLIVANNVFAHAEDLLEIAEGVKKLLHPKGMFVFEVSYLGDVVDCFAFDTIYHEHFSYHAVAPLVKMLGNLGLIVSDAEYNQEQRGRGSMRFYVHAQQAQGQSLVPFDVFRLAEKNGRLQDPATYTALGAQIKGFGDEFRWKLEGLLTAGKRLAGYGAAAKTTTLMYAAGLTRDHCEYLVDDSPWKQGMYSPGLHIPIVPPSMLTIARPDAVVIYAWNFAESILAKYKGSGIKFIIPLPTYREVIA